MIYFDQAASSFPKPRAVADAVYQAITEYGANPGRGGHALSIMAGDKIYETRVKLAAFFGLKEPKRVIFYNNATGAINQGIKGLSLQKGDHVITTSYEHNAVRRPLEHLKETIGIELTYIKLDINGQLDGNDLESHIKENTKLMVATHGSNLTGMITPIKKIGEITKKRNITFMVDASQTAGILPIHMEEMNIHILATAGHKGLLGPQGTGVLLVQPGIELDPIIQGGTGNYSEEVLQPNVWPEKLESGTLNTPGIAGLLAGVEEVEKMTLDSIYAHEYKLTKKCLEGLAKIEGITVLGPNLDNKRLAVIAFTIPGIDSHEIATILDQHYKIAVRAGIHCAPLAHESVGTIENGAVRVSFGPYNLEEEIDTFIEAIQDIKEGLLG